MTFINRDMRRALNEANRNFMADDGIGGTRIVALLVLVNLLAIGCAAWTIWTAWDCWPPSEDVSAGCRLAAAMHGGDVPHTSPDALSLSGALGQEER